MSDTDTQSREPDIENPGSFASRLYLARNALGLTQEQVAERAGLQQSTIAHYEAGRREPSLGNVRRLIWALGCGADYLMATRPGTDDDYRVGAERRAPLNVAVIYDGGRMAAGFVDRSGLPPNQVMAAVLAEHPNVVSIEITGNAEVDGA